MMNSKIVLDRLPDTDGQAVVMIYGIVVGETFGIEDGKRRLVGASTTVVPLPNKRYVEPASRGHGSPEDILEHHLDFKQWEREDT